MGRRHDIYQTRKLRLPLPDRLLAVKPQTPRTTLQPHGLCGPMAESGNSTYAYTGEPRRRGRRDKSPTRTRTHHTADDILFPETPPSQTARHSHQLHTAAPTTTDKENTVSPTAQPQRAKSSTAKSNPLSGVHLMTADRRGVKNRDRVALKPRDACACGRAGHDKSDSPEPERVDSDDSNSDE